MNAENSVPPRKDAVTAAVLVIGDEILSGRTKDKNIGYIAEYLTNIGIDLKEVRVVADEEGAIIEALDALRHRYTYVFTTGGIGPTHDDITADCVAKAFGVSIDVDPRALAAKGIGIDEVATAVQNANVNVPTGSIQGAEQQYVVQTNGQLMRAAAYGPTIISYRNGTPVRLDEVAHWLPPSASAPVGTVGASSLTPTCVRAPST